MYIIYYIGQKLEKFIENTKNGSKWQDDRNVLIKLRRLWVDCKQNIVPKYAEAKTLIQFGLNKNV